ncbi:DUF5059 domain-containing protein [Halobellus sp. Atlit-31R]|nr:DUF5059 domain-containing protein [Halobellus sp. Atlit-31R]
MAPKRRDLLTASAAMLTAGLAGCSGLQNGTETEAETQGATETASDSSSESPGVTTNAAVAAEWNAYRARVWDALALGVAGEPGSGSRVVQSTFARFEGANGEYGAHEVLEATGEKNYEGFEGALGKLRSAGLAANDVGRAREEAGRADSALANAQRTVIDGATADALDLQVLGAAAQNAGLAVTVGNVEAAGTIAENVRSRFEGSSAYEAVEAANADAYEQFEAALEGIVSAARSGDGETVRTEAGNAFTAAIDGSYAVAGTETGAGTGHVAALQARGWDAAALAGAGGPPTGYAHAAALTVYRARAYDSAWLAAHSETERAATMAGDVFAHFEGARAHEALEEADGEAYEGFEAGLSALRTAIEEGDASGVTDAVATVDSNLVTGIEALAGENASLLESGFFRIRFADARERYRRGEAGTAASIAEGLFERFERNELDVHESVESTSEELYTQFEEEHLGGLIEAFRNGDDDAVATHYDGVQATLSEFERSAGSETTVSGVEAGYMASRVFDASVVDVLGDDSRAEAIGQSAFQRFEAGAGGYHEALEEADEARYESFESELDAAITAAGAGDDVYPPATEFNGEAVASAYAIVGGGSGGAHAGAAGSVMQDAFAHFEEARVHELLEEADHNAYETFEAELDAYLAALDEGGDVGAAAGNFASAAQYAQFALVDGSEDVPVGLRLAGGSADGESGHGGHSGHGGGSEMEGGPNVVEGVPEDADHVVDMTAVAFEPAELTVSKGDTVAWKYVGGEAHSVSAYEDEIPEDAAYWASGGFDSQSAAETGWDEGKGGVGAGQSYVHTFETTGTHEYFCIPHEAAGMVGTVVVE